MSEHHIDLDKLAHERNGHSVFAPSSAAMWLTCLGSLIPNLLAPDSAGEEAAEGTVAHGVGEEWLRTGKRPSHRVGEIVEIEGFKIEITETMLDYVEAYVDWCSVQEGEHFVETHVDFSDLTPIPKQGGTSDHAACMPKRLVITDLKYGKGVKVYAEENPQGLLYAYGFFREWDWLYDFDEILIRIAQPRLGHFDEWLVTRDYLLDFAEYVRERAHLAWQLNAPRRASEKGCQWCKVKSTCAALFTDLVDMTNDVFDADDNEHDYDALSAAKDMVLSYVPDVRDPSELETAHLAKILPFRRTFEGWFADIEAELESRALAGEKIPNYKLVESRSFRDWKSESAAEFTLLDAGVPIEKIYKKSIISPAAAEEAVREASLSYAPRKMSVKAAASLFESIVLRPPGRPTLAPLSDKRESLDSIADQAFDD